MIEIFHPLYSTTKISLQPEANSKSLLKLFKNEVIEGKVLQTLSSGNVSLLIKGKRFLAQSHVPLQEGKILSLKVEDTVPIPTLKLLGVKFTDSNAVDISKILSALKENVWRSIFENTHHFGLSKEVVSPFKEMIRNVSMELFLKSSPELLWELIDKSGLNWEAKLRKALLTKKIGGATDLSKLIQSDVKGSISRFLVFADKEDGSLKNFVSVIKNIQLLDKLVLEQDRKIFLPIPMQFPDGFFTLGQLLIHLTQMGKDSDAKKIMDENPMRITFLLELSHLGPLRADLVINGKEITGRFLITKEEAASFIKNNIPSLITALKDKGFTVCAIECHCKDPETVKQSLISEIIQEEDSTIHLVA